MARPKEVSAYVTRTKRASRFSSAKAASAVRSFLPDLENAMEEAVQLERSLQEANLADRDPARAGAFEEAFQKIGAIRRITSELAPQLRTLVQAFRELEAVNARIAEEEAPAPTAAKARASASARSVKPTVVKSKPEK